ncbi:CotH kinase family protein [Parvicella tangerina]|uniref:Uncharacterized protein n=1 Tax=Parvicella tangerina TaxID=2829795 RepID=A0A916NFY2_9FLAO|nr:CotH kinase family protein [Parvicella tangerina]CAG5079561.1 hypothetical protein CRYO30217_00976 [Parvicella tangerina]
MKKLIYIFLGLSFFSCKKEIFIEYGNGLEDWTTETHSNDVSPNYNMVFNQNTVNRLDFVFTEKNWEDMQDDLEDILSSTSGPGGGGGQMTFSDDTPLYFECEMYFNDIEWYHVGIRYKGNSSLNANSGKLPFRLKMDEYEDEYVEIKNQRFYGFKELSLGSNYNDESNLQEFTEHCTWSIYF